MPRFLLLGVGVALPLSHGTPHSRCRPPQYGMQLYRNYQQAQARLSQPPWIGPTALVSVPPAPSTAPVPWGAPPGPPAATSPLSPSPQRSVSDNALVAMDFSGCTGRVIENPSEVLTAALEEAQAWRVSGGAGGSGEPPLGACSRPLFASHGQKKTTHRYSLPAACQTSPLSAGEQRPPRASEWGRGHGTPPAGGPCLMGGVPPDAPLPSPQPSTAPSPGSTGASRGRTPSSSSAARGWWMGTHRGGPGGLRGVRDPWGTRSPRGL